MPETNSTPLVRNILVTVLNFQSRRLGLEASGGEAVRKLAQRLESQVEDLWKQMAALQALGKNGASADSNCAGYVTLAIPGQPNSVLSIPFHLIPATPEIPILEEILELAARIRFAEVGGRQASICLSGSAVMLKDVLSVGDIDFCEYIPTAIPTAIMADAFLQRVVSNDSRHCTVSLRIQSSQGSSDELRFIDVKHGDSFTEEHLNLLHSLISKARNGKTSDIVRSKFAGVTEVTNWLILFNDPLEADPASRLSFAHQEASLGIFGRRPLHTLESLAAYLNFLRIEIANQALKNPVKALKRALPWLRLFQADDLRIELLNMSQRHDATLCASLLSKLELLDKYDELENLRPELAELIDDLDSEINASSRTIAPNGNMEYVLQGRIAQFGQELNQPDVRGSLLSRILSIADPVQIR